MSKTQNPSSKSHVEKVKLLHIVFLKESVEKLPEFKASPTSTTCKPNTKTMRHIVIRSSSKKTCSNAAQKERISCLQYTCPCPAKYDMLKCLEYAGQPWDWQVLNF